MKDDTGVINMITMPDGSKVALADWASSWLYSCLFSFVFGDRLLLEDTRVQLGYTVGPGEEVPPPITLEEYTTRFDVNLFRLQRHVEEFLSRERRGLRSDRQWRQLYYRYPWGYEECGDE